MLPILLFLAFAGWGSSSVGAIPTGPEAEAIIRRALPAVMTIKMLDRLQQEVGEGTGFLISADGRLVTARHVSAGGIDLVAVGADGTRHPVTGFLGDDRDFDVAILKIEGDQHPWLPLSSQPATNQWVGLATHLQKPGLACPTGSIARVIDFGGVLKHLSTTVPVQRGQSGSPMLNEAGEVLGVLFGMRADTQGSVVPIEIIREILAQPGAKSPVPAAKRPRRGGVPVFLEPAFRTGLEAMARRDFRSAIQSFSGLSRRYPDSPTVHLMLGMSYRENGSWAYAKGALAKALQHKPESGDARFLYATTLIEMGQTADGTEALDQALASGLTEPAQIPIAWALLAGTRADLKDGPGAEKALARLEAIDPRRAAGTRKKIQEKHPGLLPAPGAVQ